MRLIELEIQNLGVHKDFSLDVSKRNNRLIFLNGSNNHGKTSLLTALEFCLFDAGLAPENLSKLAARDLEVNQETSVRVRIKVQLHTGDEAIINREQEFWRDAKGEIQVAVDSQLTITLVPADFHDKATILPSPDKWLNANFPSRFKDFILFDGEKMSKFLDTRVKNAIENVVREIASIDYFEARVAMTKAVRDQSRKKQAKLVSKSAEKANGEKERLEQLLAEAKAGLDQCVSALRDRRAEKARLEPVIEGYKHGGEYLAKNRKHRETLDALVQQINEEEQELGQKLWATALNSFFVDRLSYPIMKQIDLADKAGRYPADFKPEALESLLEKGDCICGRHLGDDKEASQALRRLIQQNLNAGRLGQELSSLKSTLDRATGQAESSQAQVETLRKGIRKLKDEARETQLAIDELEPKLAGLSNSESEILQTQKEFGVAEDAIRNLQQVDIPTANTRVGHFEKEIQQKTKEYDAAIKNSSQAQLLGTEIDFLNRVLDQSENFGAQVLERVRSRLQSFVSQKFGETDGGRYETQISEDFEVTTLNLDGTHAKLSEGQKMVRAYMFSFALRSVIGLDLPLIVDTPIGRLDEKNRMFVAETLTGVFEDSENTHQQAIFLMHDGEYTPYVMEHFKQLSPLEFYLEHFDQEYEFSKLKEGIDPEWYEYTAWADYKKQEGLR